MLEHHLSRFTCPRDGAPLRWEGIAEQSADGEILTGAAACANGHSYTVAGGVLRFVPGAEYAGSFGFEWKRFARTQLDSQSGQSASREAFIDKTGLPPEVLKGARVLDGGCGTGRYSEIALDLGAESVCGVDLSEAVEVARQNLSGDPRFCYAQADILELPLPAESFDVVFSIGVLHHTPNTRSAFLRLARCVKPGGWMAVYVYSGEWKNRVNWFFSDLYRHITRRMSRDRLLRLCERWVPRLHKWHSFWFRVNKYLGIASHTLVPISMDPNPDWRVLDTFDWYSPRYQWKHTFREVEGWFREAGFEHITRNRPAVCVKGSMPPR